MRLVCPGPRPLGPLFALLALLAGCVGAPGPAGPPDVDQATFEALVYPILVRDCAFPACHGQAGRFLRVHGPGRSRLSEETALSAPATDEEMTLAFERTRSMLASAESPEASLLLRKPLELDQGGAPHMGVDRFGRDVFADTLDPAYLALLQWAGSQRGAP